jgi:hypothetical protein
MKACNRIGLDQILAKYENYVLAYMSMGASSFYLGQQQKPFQTQTKNG